MKRALVACSVTAAVGAALAPALAQANETETEAAAQAASDLNARVGMDCSAGRLQLVLENGSSSETTFTVQSGDDTYTRTVAAGGSTELEWQRADGSSYNLVTTAPGDFQQTRKGTVGCGLQDGEPQLNTTKLFDTDTTFKGLLGADGSEYDGTAKSVRIPSMAVTNNGTVLAATDARVDGSGDLPGNIQVGLRRSTDNGASWSDATIVAHSDSTDTGTGDSSLLVDRTTGRVFLFYNLAGPGSGFNEDDPDGGQQLTYLASDDDGATWSKPVSVNSQVKQSGWKNQFLSSGHGIQAANGRLIQPVVYRDANGSHTGNILSDDDGKTWRFGAEAGADVNESKAVQRSTGAIEQNMRHNSGKTRYRASSKDGASDFGEMSAVDALPDPGNNADEIAYLSPTSGAPNLTKKALFSNTASASARHELTVRLSENDGSSWSQSAVVKSGEAGYSTLSVLKDGSVGDLYEVGDTGGVYFARFSLDHLQ